MKSVSVDMGVPRLKRHEIPLQKPMDLEPVVNEPIECHGKVFYGTCVSMGNPHCVFFVDHVHDVDLETIGPKLEHHLYISPKGEY